MRKIRTLKELNQRLFTVTRCPQKSGEDKAAVTHNCCYFCSKLKTTYCPIFGGEFRYPTHMGRLLGKNVINRLTEVCES